ncbi:hypothetical protein TIFTF001_035158 [Ficus carica]|uniref:Uncharacterized protein n=1 Tax=Ficus carica TaxID=3494 RepID=A0AA88E1W4_FICCA|nr:hypothetical protein TIFTF001_035158 [Ficus carica]
MTAVCVFIKHNGTLRYVGGEMKGISVLLTATYVGLIEFVRNVIGMRSLKKTIVMRYAVEPEMPPVRIQCDADVNFYIQLKKNDIHVLSKFPISIDVLDVSMAEAIPPKVGESSHILVQPSRVGGQSDEAVQLLAVNNLVIHSPIPHVIPSPIAGLNLHIEDGLEEQDEFLNIDFGMDHDDCNTGEFNIEEAARDSNDKSTAGSIRSQFVVNRTKTQYVHVSSSDNFSGVVIIADFTPITMCVNNIFDNKKLLQYHLHYDAMSKYYQFKVKRTTTTLFFVVIFITLA